MRYIVGDRANPRDHWRCSYDTQLCEKYILFFKKKIELGFSTMKKNHSKFNDIF
jgi:hypothetical protein